MFHAFGVSTDKSEKVKHFPIELSLCNRIQIQKTSKADNEFRTCASRSITNSTPASLKASRLKKTFSNSSPWMKTPNTKWTPLLQLVTYFSVIVLDWFQTSLTAGRSSGFNHLAPFNDWRPMIDIDTCLCEFI